MGSTSRIWSHIRSCKLLVSFPVWNRQRGRGSAIKLSLCTTALGNPCVLSGKHLFPCSPWGSLGGPVVWVISANKWYASVRREKRCGCSSWASSILSFIWSLTLLRQVTHESMWLEVSLESLPSLTLFDGAVQHSLWNSISKWSVLLSKPYEAAKYVFLLCLGFLYRCSH